MQCTQCNWQNPASYTHCFSCNAPLAAAGEGPGPRAAGAASGEARPRSKPSPTPSPAQHAQAAIFPSMLARLGATLIDGLAMAAVPVALLTAWALASSALDGAPPGPLLAAALALGALGLLLPGLMDALGAGSFGKRALGLRVVTRAGERPGVARSALRHFLKYSLTLGLTLAVPFLLHRVLTALFGERGLHSSMTGTFVVARDADDATIQEAIAKAPGPGWFLKGLVVLGGMAVLGLAVVVALVLWSPRSEPANPLRDTVRQLDGAARVVLQLVENHYRSTGKFPPSAAAIGLGQSGPTERLPAGFQALSIDPASGVVRLTIAEGVGGTEGAALAGKHLVYTPLLRTRKQQTDIRQWQCGSDDIARSDRPFQCRHASTRAAP
ncbi:RDD family protein [Acidovorax sp. Q11]